MAVIKHLEQKFAFAHYRLITSCEANELQLYLFLKLYAINKSNAFPSAKTVMEQLNWSRDKFFNTIKKMEAKKRLAVNRRNGRSSVFDITWYDLQNQHEVIHNQSENQTTYQSGNQTGGSPKIRRVPVWKSDTNKKKRIKRNITIDFHSEINPQTGEDLGFVRTS